jgi:exodeoxyribonuclease V alpha subunit
LFTKCQRGADRGRGRHPDFRGGGAEWHGGGEEAAAHPGSVADFDGSAKAPLLLDARPGFRSARRVVEKAPITPLDTHFAALMLRLHGAPHPVLERAARWVSAQRAEGHICATIAAEDAAQLRSTRVVGAPGEDKPLILDAHGRLYLHRYWQYESQLAAAIRARIGTEAAHDPALLQRGLTRLFGKKTKTADWQRLATETAVQRNFCVITGGPGTGKTWTVVAVLALLHEQFAAQRKKLRVALAAPTGKAAARMLESIQRTLERDPAFADARSAIPHDATTLHRLLGTIPDSPCFRHDAARPLAVDAVLVDEASMVDLALMAKLFAAVPPGARLVLLGDKDQLASVEAGYVLGDICHAPLPGHIVELRKNRRFAEGSGIQLFSQSVNAGDAEAALALLDTPRADLLSAPLPAPAALPDALRARIIGGYRACLDTHDPREALTQLGKFRILCAVRRGPHGVENLNRIAEAVLTDAGLIESETTGAYRGRPVLVTVNDHPLQLYNGDVGILLPDPEAGGELRAWFLDAGGNLRRILPARLPAHETVFAMTVHKSQGSEFQRVLFLLPERDTPVATRELLYTAITRARDSVELWHRPEVLRTAIARRTERTSGLRDALTVSSAAARLEGHAPSSP